MESTGVYWIPLYELLESRDFTAYLVNARHVKNVSDRKSDVLDRQWLQQLMSYGLLSGAFCPRDEICALRALTLQRDMLMRYSFLPERRACGTRGWDAQNVGSRPHRHQDSPSLENPATARPRSASRSLSLTKACRRKASSWHVSGRRCLKCGSARAATCDRWSAART
jgi:hypothetical protein